MMITTKSKFAPLNYKGNIKNIPLSTIIDYITFTCILYVENGNHTGALYFKKGDLIGARLNNEFNINKTDEILEWNSGSYSYHPWENSFEIEIIQSRDVFYFTEIANLDAKINIIFDEEASDFRISAGKIVSILPKSEDINVLINTVIKSKKGRINIKLNGGQTGDLDVYFTEIYNSDYLAKNKILNRSKNLKKTSKPECQLDLEIIEDSFSNLIKTMDKCFIAGSVYTSNLGKPVYSYKSEANQSALFASLHKNLNNLINSSISLKIRDYYLLDLNDNYLVFILTFKEHHIGLLFQKSEIKLGYLLNIIRPILINDYNNAIKSKQ